MILLFTDFGISDPYTGQMHAAIRRIVDLPVIDLMHEVPDYDVRAGAYLLDALQRYCREGDVFVCVVDPGVGGDRAPLALKADGKWYIGPDNGLLSMVHRRADSAQVFRVDWRPEALSSSFHGRDLFGPVAAMLAAGEDVQCTPAKPGVCVDWPDDLGEIIYIDHYGNAMTGYRAGSISENSIVEIAGRRLTYRRTFSAAGDGEAFWYRNAIGLVEIAARESSAARVLGLTPGDRARIIDYDALMKDKP